MEVLIDCYFDKFFEQMDRSSLASRHRRRQLVKFFSDLVNNVAEGKRFSSNLLIYILSRVSTKKKTIDFCFRGFIKPTVYNLEDSNFYFLGFSEESFLLFKCIFS